MSFSTIRKASLNRFRKETGKWTLVCAIMLPQSRSPSSANYFDLLEYRKRPSTGRDCSSFSSSLSDIVSVGAVNSEKCVDGATGFAISVVNEKGFSSLLIVGAAAVRSSSDTALVVGAG